MKLHIMGDSHVVAIRSYRKTDEGQAFDISPFESVDITRITTLPGILEPFHVRIDQGVTLSEAALKPKVARQLTGPLTIRAEPDRIYGFTMAYSTSFFLWADQWRTYRPWRFSSDKHTPLSDAVVKAMAVHHMQHVFAFFETMLEAGIQFFAIESVPLRKDDRALRTKAMGPKSLLEIDRIAREGIAEELTSMGIDTVFASPEAYIGGRGESFLKPEYRRRMGDDTHHGNLLYGGLQFKEILAYGRAKFTVKQAVSQ